MKGRSFSQIGSTHSVSYEPGSKNVWIRTVVGCVMADSVFVRDHHRDLYDKDNTVSNDKNPNPDPDVF